MATFGEFREVGNKRKFCVRGCDLTVDESSVSSEWTSDEEDVKVQSSFDNTAPPKQGSLVGKAKKKRVKKWRVRHSLAKYRHLCDASSSDRSSASSSKSDGSETTSSGSDSAQDDTVPKAEKRQVRNNRRMTSEAQMVELKRDLPPGSNGGLQWVSGSKQHRDLAFAPNFLSADDIEAITRAAKHDSVKEIHDRKGYLAFKHRVVRFEMQLRALAPDLYNRLLELIRNADLETWKKLRKKKNKVYPEIEYIEYDVKLEDGECFIEPHVDNKSGVTLVAMLSPSCDYVGGNSCFRRGTGNEGHRQARLEQGDMVLFRGEKLLHWITNVTSGRRVILQIELSRL